MVVLFATLLVFIFVMLSGIHIYWACGGQWGIHAVVPSKDDGKKLFVPRKGSTFIVAMGLLFFAGLAILRAMGASETLSSYGTWLYCYGLWFVAGLFILRTIGDFRYVGIFKKHKNSIFATQDSRYYIPFCLLITILAVLLNLS